MLKVNQVIWNYKVLRKLFKGDFIMLVSLKEILDIAEKGSFAVPAF